MKFFSLVISAMQFLTIAKRGFLLVSQLNTHGESVEMIFFMSSMPISFETNLRLHTQISKATSLSKIMGEALDFVKI